MRHPPFLPAGISLLLLALETAGCGARTGLLDDSAGSSTGGSSTGGAPCVGGQCNAPPPPTCVSTTTVRSYDDTGTCTAGTCSYAFTDTPCAVGCTGGVCAAVTSPRSLSVGYTFSCVVIAGGVTCWGGNVQGTQSDGTLVIVNSTVPVAVQGLPPDVIMVSAGDFHVCALTASGGVWCWGANESGQLGDGSQGPFPVAAPVGVTGLSSGVVAVSAGANHTCALTSAGAVTCWGRNNAGELGNGSLVDSPTPVPVVGLSSGALAVTAGFDHSCAITSAGALLCWGNNYFGAFGQSSTSMTQVPVDNTGLTSSIVDVNAGANHTCALSSAGAVKCWGLNGNYELGNAFVTESPDPLNVPGLSGVVAVAAGGTRSCALTAAGAVDCWGNGVAFPAEVKGLSSGFVAISASDNGHACALAASGGVKCWGFNGFGELGDGTQIASDVPVDVIGL